MKTLELLQFFVPRARKTRFGSGLPVGQAKKRHLRSVLAWNSPIDVRESRPDRNRAIAPPSRSTARGTRSVVIGLMVLFSLPMSARFDEKLSDQTPQVAPEVDALWDSKWQESLRLASAEEKPIVLFSQPERCDPDRKVDPCAAVTSITAHPAMIRHLRNVVFLTHVSKAIEEPSLSVFSPSGLLAVQWFLIPDVSGLLKAMALVDGAAPHLLAASRAEDVEGSEGKRAWILAILALGRAEHGRQLLESLRASSIEEDRQLATIWLAHLDAHQQKSAPSEELMTRMTREGVSDRVRFEAWMSLGRLGWAQGRADAAPLFQRALDIAPSDGRHAALDALREAEERASSILGLGTPSSVVVGRRTIQPRTSGKGAAKVEFRIDGRLVATAKRSPFAASVNFGRIPRRQVLDVTALDGSGSVLHRSNAVVNQRSDEFSIRIVEPKSFDLRGVVPVAISTQVPRGRSIARVFVEWNGMLVATLPTSPFRTEVDVKDGEPGILRAVLRLDDGSEVEDVILANSGAMNLESDVNLVEVPVYADKRALTLEGLSLMEGGKRRSIDRIVPAADAPMRIALVLDTSRSMTDHILDVQEAAIRFVETKLGARDQVMMVAFNQRFQVLWPTNDRESIERAILGIQPQGATSLHDAMTVALLQIPTTGWRRAIVVFSDGLDSGSLFTSGDVAEVARRSGVPIYVLSLRPTIGPYAPRSGRNAVLTPSPFEVVRREQGRLKGLSRSTGGKAFDLKSLDDLDEMWTEIGDDLQKQSLVIYRTEAGGDEWRPLEVVMRGGGKLRAPEGVYVASEDPEAEEAP